MNESFSHAGAWGITLIVIVLVNLYLIQIQGFKSGLLD